MPTKKKRDAGRDRGHQTPDGDAPGTGTSHARSPRRRHSACRRRA
jgi:hypothetical protein